MKEGFSVRVKLLISIVLLLVAVHVFNTVTLGSLNQFGIAPRHTGSWYHVFLAPFIHGSWEHLLNNLVGFVIFSALCLMRPIRYYLTASLFIIAVSGALVWLFGRSAFHIGASGWIFGLWCLCIAAAWFDRSMKNIVIACVVVFFYGGMVFGVLPTQPGVSFEAHLFGALAGALFAAIASKRPHFKERQQYENI